MDFYKIKERSGKGGIIEIYPDFRVCRSKDLMVRGKSFYAIFDSETNLWSTDEYDVQRLVDNELREFYEHARQTRTDVIFSVKWLSDFSSGSWNQFKKYVTLLADNAVQLDQKVTYLSQKVSRKDYASKRLPYDLDESGYSEGYDELISTLYDPEERQKIEWAIGSIIEGDSPRIQKFIALYGEAGSGKSTVLNIIEQLFAGYVTFFDGKALTSSTNQFALETLKNGPLVAIQHDADLSKIEDNTRLNSIVSHEEMTVNEKYKSAYSARFNCFLFLASNKPVRITDAKSGLIRRLIDVHPSGRRIRNGRYNELIERISFELGGIARHCSEVYKSLGSNYYGDYRPVDMMFKTDPFFNFVEANYQIFSEEEGISLKQAYDIYKQYCDEALVDFKLPRHKFREELKNYFDNFEEVARVGDRQIRSYFTGFDKDKFRQDPLESKYKKDIVPDWLNFKEQQSNFDIEYASARAQYANEKGSPSYRWESVSTTLSQIDTRKLHYVMFPENSGHITVDFDIRNSKGEKDLDANIKAASSWPKTYGELSKSGGGIHLEYTTDIPVDKIKLEFAEGIEIKRFNGKASLRRKLTKCNNLPIAKINSGLPLKEGKMVDFQGLKNEKALRTMIHRNLNKEIHGYTKPSIIFIYDILEQAYTNGMKYDVSDLYTDVLAFANNSSNNAEFCVNLVSKMKFKSDEENEWTDISKDDRLAFFDVEVFPNLFLVNWKFQGDGNPVVRMINPEPKEIENMMNSFKLVGFNCRRYDNHILYARYLGYSNEELFELSKRIISDEKNRGVNVLFREAYNISYTDVYDFSSKKQSLKKFEIELGIHHQELGLPWDQPVPQEKWVEVAEYCDNDVLATEAVFNDRKADWTARQILSELSGLSVNHTTQQHTARIIFGDDPEPQSKFIYTDLSEQFPGYSYENGKSSYRGKNPSEGGYVSAKPGMYTDVALLDIESLHPSSIENLNLFGPYTKNFSDLKRARILIKHGDFDQAKDMFDGKLAKYLTDKKTAKDLSYALKIAINIVYGLTSAKFPNKFKDPRNKDNIVAKRGALFMINLEEEVEKRGYTVAHIKTDSIKIPNADKDIISFVMDYAKHYGYSFAHEATYSKMCLVNDAVYIAKYSPSEECEKLYGYSPEENASHGGEWTATGAQFAQPYVFKKLFSKEPIEFKDLCETRTVTGGYLYLDMNESLPDVSEYEKRVQQIYSKNKEGPTEELENELDILMSKISEGHKYVFVGKAGLFCPISPGCGGGELLRENNGKYYAAAGTKGYRWLESEVVEKLHKEDDIDITYYNDLVLDAMRNIGKYGDLNWFVGTDNDIVPWSLPCGDEKLGSCHECPNFYQDPTGCLCEKGYDLKGFIFERSED